MVHGYQLRSVREGRLDLDFVNHFGNAVHDIGTLEDGPPRAHELANAAAIAYVEFRLADGTTLFGVGIDKNIVVASLKAVVSGVNRAGKR